MKYGETVKYGETEETVADFIFLGSKITADGDRSHEIKRHLLLERKAMTNLDSIFKSRDITLVTSPSSQSYGFPSSHVWMWERDINKAEHNFELWYWRRLLRVPWTAWKSNHSILKEINPEYSLKDYCWSSNNLATWWEVLTHWKRPWCWESLNTKEEECGRVCNG